MKMFQKIQELIDDRDALVCVLIDEVLNEVQVGVFIFVITHGIQLL